MSEEVDLHATMDPIALENHPSMFPSSGIVSPTMREALFYAETSGGKIHRHAGGFWSREDWLLKTERYFGSSTIQALVARGFLVFDVWKDRKHTRSAAAMRFPIRASLTDAGKAAIHGGS